MNNRKCGIGNKGSSLVMVIIVMAVLTILAVIMLDLGLSSARTTAHQDKVKQAYYLARSGADAAATYLINNANEDTKLFGRTTSSVSSAGLTNGTIQVNVMKDNATGKVFITGTGTVDDVQKNAIAVLYRKKISEIGDKAIYSGNDLDLKGMKVKGDVESAGTIDYRTTGSNKFDDNAYPNSAKEIELADFPVLTPYGVQDLTVSNHDVTTITGSYSLNSITINQQGKLRIFCDQPGETIQIVVNTISIDNILEIDPGTNGSVEIFVNNLLEIQTSGVINNTHPKYLHIYMKDGSLFDMQANMIFNGYVIGPNADFLIQSDQSSINGYIIAKSVTKNGSNGANGAVNYIPEEDPEDIPDYIKGYKIIEWSE